MGTLTAHILKGTVPAGTSSAPLFRDKYPGWIPPTDPINYSDNLSGSGGITGRSLPTSPTGAAAWTGSAVSLSASGGGYAYTADTSATGVFAYFEAPASGPSGHMLLRFTYGDDAPGDGNVTGIGLALRFADSSNYLRIAVFTSITIVQRVSGTSTTLASTGFSPVIGQEYDLLVEWDGDYVRCFVSPVGDMAAGVGVSTELATALQSNTRLALYFLRAGCHAEEFRAAV